MCMCGCKITENCVPLQIIDHKHMDEFWQKFKRGFNRHPVLYNILLALASIVALVWLSLVFLDLWTHHGATSVVPDIKFMEYPVAVDRLAENDLEIEVSDSIYMSEITDSTYNRRVRPGMVLETWPKAGAVVKRGRPVYVTIVAYSPKEVTVSTPVDNISSRQAISILQSLGINNVRIVYVPSYYNDNVERALYNGRTINVGSTLPVTATVTLEVGQAISPEPQEEYTDSLGTADSIGGELPDEGESIIIDDQTIEEDD